MKKIPLYFTGLLSLIALQVISQNRSINFDHGTFKELKARAIKENKLIFVDAYTTWCGPCKWMAKNVFTNDTVADFYNANFINAKIDMEKGEGIELAKQYEVMCYPNLLFIDGNGNLQHRMAGSMNVSDFVALANTAKMKDQNFAYYKTNYEANKSNTEFLQKYIKALDQTCLDPKDQVALYFSMQKEEKLTSMENWEMMKSYVHDMDSKEFKYLMANKKKFDELYTEKAVNEKVDEVNFQSLARIAQEKPFDQVKYDETKSKIKAANIGNSGLVIFEVDLRLAQKNKDWTSYAKLANEYVDKYYSKDANTLNSIAWTYYEHISDKASLAKAEAWSKLSTELEPSYANLDTYASVLYKSGKKQKALEAANKAIEVAKQEGYAEGDYKSTSDLLKSIQEMK